MIGPFYITMVEAGTETKFPPGLWDTPSQGYPKAIDASPEKFLIDAIKLLRGGHFKSHCQVCISKQ